MITISNKFCSILLFSIINMLSCFYIRQIKCIFTRNKIIIKIFFFFIT